MQCFPLRVVLDKVSDLLKKKNRTKQNLKVSLERAYSQAQKPSGPGVLLPWTLASEQGSSTPAPLSSSRGCSQGHYKRRLSDLLHQNWSHTHLPWWLRRWGILLQCRRPGFHPWVGKISWRRGWLPTPVFLLGKFMDTGAWWAIVHGVAKSWIWLSS